MTKLINADELINSFDNSDFDNTDPADNLMNAVHIVNSMPYVEAYSKKEVIAMLNELQLEIEKQCMIPNNNASAYDWNNGVYACYKVIARKVDTLKKSD